MTDDEIRAVRSSPYGQLWMKMVALALEAVAEGPPGEFPMQPPSRARCAENDTAWRNYQVLRGRWRRRAQSYEWAREWLEDPNGFCAAVLAALGFEHYELLRHLLCPDEGRGPESGHSALRGLVECPDSTRHREVS